ncbi:MAG TPA: RDD family protein [Candidatus Acidoferrales bacterium]
MREEWHPAEPEDRLGADFIDACLGAIVALPAYLLVDRALLSRTTGFLDSTVMQVVLVAWFLWNMTYLVGRTGQSWGGKLAGLKVVNADGEPIGFWRALGRNLFAICISWPLVLLGFLWVIWDPQKQAWHDKIFRTFVVRRVVL